MPQRSKARILAPLALVAFVLAVVVVVAGSSGSGDEPVTAPERGKNRSTRTSTTSKRTSTAKRSATTTTSTTPPKGATVTVQAGDTPSAIAAREGVTVQQLLDANLGLNPRALRTGQVLKLAP